MKVKELTMYSVNKLDMKLSKIELEKEPFLEILNPDWNIEGIQYGRDSHGKIQKFILTIEKKQTEDRKEKENENY